MAIWKQSIELADLQRFSRNSVVEWLDIRYLEIGEDYLRGTMPVDHRTHQPTGILHGGASVVLAETLGSTAAQLAAPPGSRVVGLEVNANHLRSVREGRVTGTATALHIGRSTQVWTIEIVDERQRRVCVSRLTMAVLAE
jgi:1,4-dihydroxy-2-naphthoyl-CoA hydrolase